MNLLLVSYQFERKGEKKKRGNLLFSIAQANPELATLFVSAEAIGLGVGLQIFRLV